MYMYVSDNKHIIIIIIIPDQMTMPPCKARRQWLLTFQVSSYCPLSLQISLTIIQKNREVSMLTMIRTFTGKLFDWNVHPLEDVSRWSDPQLQVCKKLFKFDKMAVDDFFI